jgi:hypothetical protein
VQVGVLHRGVYRVLLSLALAMHWSAAVCPIGLVSLLFSLLLSAFCCQPSVCTQQ